MSEISVGKRLLAAGGLGVAIFIGGEAMHHEGANKAAALTLEWIGGVAAVGAGYAGTRRGLDIMVTNQFIEREKRREEVMSRLPMLASEEQGLEETFLRLKIAPDDIKSMFEDNRLSLNPLARAYENSVHMRKYNIMDKDEEGLYEGLALVNDRLVQDRVDGYRLRSNKLRASVVETCLVLDEITPIDPSCSRTPDTGDGGKYWYEWIEAQARPLISSHMTAA